MMHQLKVILFTSLSLFLTACSSSINPETGQRNDPLEGFNRAMWKINYDYLDPYVVEPYRFFRL